MQAGGMDNRLFPDRSKPLMPQAGSQMVWPGCGAITSTIAAMSMRGVKFDPSHPLHWLHSSPANLRKRHPLKGTRVAFPHRLEKMRYFTNSAILSMIRSASASVTALNQMPCGYSITFEPFAQRPIQPL